MQNCASDEKDVEGVFQVSPEFGIQMLNELSRIVIPVYTNAHFLRLSIEDTNDAYQKTMLQRGMRGGNPASTPCGHFG